MAKNLTKKEVEFVKEVTLTGNATQSVKKVFGIKDENYAGVKGNRLLRKDKIQRVVKSIADQIPDKLLVKKHLELLNSTETIVAGGEIISENINVQGVKAGLDMAYKLKGKYAPDQSTVTVKVEKLEEIQKATANILKNG